MAPPVNTIHRAAIAETLAARTGLSQVKANAFVKETFRILLHEIVHDGYLTIHGFGTFELKHKKARWHSDPRNGNRVWAGDKMLVKFTQGKTLTAQLEMLARERDSGRMTEDYGDLDAETTPDVQSDLPEDE